MYVSMPVQLRGVSHTGMKHDPKITIKTKDGNKLYNKLCVELKESDNIEEFQKNCAKETRLYYKLLSDFLNDEKSIKEHKMDDNDVSGWNIYYQLLDTYTIYKHFSEYKRV